MRRGGASSGLPVYSYTGSCLLIDDGNENWQLKFLTSGVLTFTKLGNAKKGIDVFLVGGGGGAAYVSGGGGGYTTNTSTTVAANTQYSIMIGAGGVGYKATSSTSLPVEGGNTTAFNITAMGGGVGKHYGKAGDGGSGGSARSNNLAGGSDGSNGKGDTYAGIGQGSTTRAFAEADGTLYASGGGTGSGSSTGKPAAANTGDGGQGGGLVNSGGAKPAGAGGSGIVIIRNRRMA